MGRGKSSDEERTGIRARRAGGAVLSALASVICAVLLSHAFVAGWPSVGGAPAGPAADLAFLAALAGSALMFAPVRDPGPFGRALLPWWWSAMVVSACALAGLAMERPALTAPGLLSATFGVSLVLATATVAGSGRPTRPGLRKPALLVLAAILALAPVWLAPAAEMFAPDTRLANLAVGISPLSVLGAASGFDYLRTDWFYQHSALGSLRYVYPPPAGYVAACLAIGVAGTSLALCQWFAESRTPAPPEGRGAGPALHPPERTEV